MKKLLSVATILVALSVCTVPAYASVMRAHASHRVHCYGGEPPIVYTPLEPPDHVDVVHVQAQ